MKDELIELIVSADENYEVLKCFKERPKRRQAAEIIADKILEDGWIKPPCKEGDTIYKIVKFCGENTGYKEFYRPTIEFKEDCPHYELAAWYDEGDRCTTAEDYGKGDYCNLNLKVLCGDCKGRFAIQRDIFTYSKMKQIYGTPMFDENTSLEDRYYLTMEDAEKALEEIRSGK